MLETFDVLPSSDGGRGVRRGDAACEGLWGSAPCTPEGGVSGRRTRAVCKDAVIATAPADQRTARVRSEPAIEPHGQKRQLQRSADPWPKAKALARPKAKADSGGWTSHNRRNSWLPAVRVRERGPVTEVVLAGPAAPPDASYSDHPSRTVLRLYLR